MSRLGARGLQPPTHSLDQRIRTTHHNRHKIRGSLCLTSGEPGMFTRLIRSQTNDHFHWACVDIWLFILMYGRPFGRSQSLLILS